MHSTTSAVCGPVLAESSPVPVDYGRQRTDVITVASVRFEIQLVVVRSPYARVAQYY